MHGAASSERPAWFLHNGIRLSVAMADIFDALTLFYITPAALGSTSKVCSSLLLAVPVMLPVPRNYVSQSSATSGGDRN